MVENSYLDVVGGNKTQKLAKTTSAGVGDANKIVALNNNGRIDESMMPPGIVADTESIEGYENLAAKDLVNVFLDNADSPPSRKIRKADADNGREAHGFVLSPVVAPAEGVVYFEGTIPGFTGLTPGAKQFLSATAGGRTETAPSGSGNLVQRIGTAISDTEISFEIDDPTTLA